LSIQTKDNDTIAAVVGAAVGALHGKKGLPERWIANLSGRTTDRDDGRIFEILEQIIRVLGARAEECFFWATHAGAELDLLIVRGQQRLGFEIKRASSPRVTSSMRSALSDLKLQRPDVIHAGDNTVPLGESIRAVFVTRLLDDLKSLR
jgi:predicted AAA+ superfamily ATPase